MRKQYANHCTKQLCEDETQNRAPTNASRERFDEGDQRIEMRAADTAKRKDQREQAATRGEFAKMLYRALSRL